MIYEVCCQQVKFLSVRVKKIRINKEKRIRQNSSRLHKREEHSQDDTHDTKQNKTTHVVTITKAGISHKHVHLIIRTKISLNAYQNPFMLFIFWSFIASLALNSPVFLCFIQQLVMDHPDDYIWLEQLEERLQKKSCTVTDWNET